MVLFQEGVDKLSPSTDIRPLKFHVPLQRGSSETILKEMHQQRLVLSMSGHLTAVGTNVSLWTGDSLVFIKIWHFELRGNNNPRYQAHSSSVETRSFSNLNGLKAFFESLVHLSSLGQLSSKIMFKINNLMVVIHYLCYTLNRNLLSFYSPISRVSRSILCQSSNALSELFLSLDNDMESLHKLGHSFPHNIHIPPEGSLILFKLIHDPLVAPGAVRM